MKVYVWESALPSSVISFIVCRLPPRPQGSGHPPRTACERHDDGHRYDAVRRGHRWNERQGDSEVQYSTATAVRTRIRRNAETTGYRTETLVEALFAEHRRPDHTGRPPGDGAKRRRVGASLVCDGVTNPGSKRSASRDSGRDATIRTGRIHRPRQTRRRRYPLPSGTKRLCRLHRSSRACNPETFDRPRSPSGCTGVHRSLKRRCTGVYGLETSQTVIGIQTVASRTADRMPRSLPAQAPRNSPPRVAAHGPHESYRTGQTAGESGPAGGRCERVLR
jgi:hypothetical protein